MNAADHPTPDRPTPGHPDGGAWAATGSGVEPEVAVSDREHQLALQELDSDDVALLAAVRALYDETDPVPVGLVDRIRFELTLDALHAEVATLTQLDLEAAGARGAATEAVRTITFTSESLTTMVTLTAQEDGAVRVDGWAAPGAGVRVEVRLATETRETTADEDGRFVFEDLPSGRTRFALYLPGTDPPTTVVSPTVEL
ncbi:MAG: hypothetical protein JWP61_287 [Friedmanniella sp.]|nr:hypothetical protein [Friedmanniella sp.]